MSLDSGIHVIAEAGTNHGGDVQRARELVDVALRAGADSVKFQFLFPEGLYLPEFLTEQGYQPNEVFQKRLDGMLDEEGFREVHQYCQEKDLSLSASIFDKRGLELLESMDPPYIKLASCDLNNGPLLRRVGETGRKMIVSTGMATLGEIDKAVDQIVATGNTDIVLLHCVSVYPCPLERMNLSFLTTLQTAFGFPVGLSDHTESSLAAAMAICLGATWIEKHYTLDRGAEGFDHAYAMEPEMLERFVADVRAAEDALSRPNVKLGESERNVKQRARRGLYAARDMQPGEVIREEDVLIVRPEGTLRPNDVSLLIGRPLAHAIARFAPFDYDTLDWTEAT
ncbi:N,N'-diacetyllegionaminic acid synthase [Planctomycetes bacterium Pan216]|uniref:N,N'-diacetyllegionaminic acid synthase n=1 Tax=Kolteria novifilia TaxID=2527975 RepID=A0A518B3I6_9BACT|nr:N,N'-diacetyllegionaminic acid synthase [Planctomycetes bacterium Pan216]